MSKLSEIAATPIDSVQQHAAICVAPTAQLIDVVRTMRESRVTAVVVGSRSGVPGVLGIFTERDLMLRVDQRDSAWRTKPVSDFMTPTPTMMRNDQPIEDVINALLVGEFRHLPLTDADGGLTGIVSIADLLAHIAEFFPDDFLNLPPDPSHEATRRWGG